MTPNATPLILVTTAGKIGAEASRLLAQRGAAPRSFELATDYAAAFSPTLVAR